MEGNTEDDRFYGIDERFKELIMGYIKSASFSTLMEGSPTKLFRTQRGIRQGYPLSSLIFIMVLDYFSRLIVMALEQKRI